MHITLPKCALGIAAWVWFAAVGAACRPISGHPAPSRSAAPLASASAPLPVPAPLPAVVLEGTTCRGLDPLGAAAVARLLGSATSAELTAGHCAAGERLEAGVGLEPGARYVVDLVSLAPVGPVQVTLEVHPEVEPRPLIETTAAAPEGEFRVLTIPEAGIVWEDRREVRARLVVVALRGAGVVGARLRSVATSPARR